MDALNRYREKFEALGQRERGLVLAVALVLVYALWNLIIGGAQTAQLKQIQLEISQLEQDLQAQNQQISDLQTKQNQDPDAEIRRQIAQTRLDLKKVDDRLAGLSVGLIAAADLPKVLENVLLQTESLKLISLQTLPIQQLQLTDEAVEANADLITGVFKHRVRVKLEGSYFDIEKYMSALEQLPWRFFWADLRYKVTRYPAAEAELEVYTLTTERGHFGA
ncbi:hypothetical protein [Simiduia aestuariiviva]|uniref:MSHA biogenesis protein MshJ n=1 Tax=Simiduia aestuariiviva TaxID=1510459 RepID=A0A839US76_9GAMM|nr:hypothetical protein [Simiduia aestuariiviva]MBB3168766.1 MSHA biogenesis protein MshJ [Simiduia aestuariiviva]